MNKKLDFKNILQRFRGLFSLGISDIIGTGISALFWLYLATLLEVESYGEISYLLAIAGMVTAISLLGSKYTIAVYVPKNIQLESAFFLIVIIISSASSLVLFLIYDNAELSLYVLGAVIFGLGTAEIIAKKLYMNYSKYLLVQKVLMVVLSITLYYWIGMNGIILGIALSYFGYTKIIIKTFKVTPIDFSLLKPRLGFLMNSYLMDIVANLGKQIDKLILAPLLGFALLGNYQLGIQFISIFYLLPLIIMKYSLPEDASGIPNKNLKIVTILVSFCFTILIIFISPLIIPIFFQKFTHVIEIIQILSISVVLFAINLMYASKFLGNEKSKIILIGNSLFSASYIIIILIIGNSIDVVNVAAVYVMSMAIPIVFYITVDLKNKICKT